ncbi:MAG: Lrp/AsnC family transcriptional regulator [Beijerinckiaceae bacterium]|nr:Lrp/AsnC family transcriptional regulator [Beijerinckiaceae bacterium]
MRQRLDQTDWKILAELQTEGRMTNVELAKRIGISAPPCLRRVRALEEAGLIKGYRALLDAKQLGFDLTCFAMVHLDSQAEPDLMAFSAKIKQWHIVRECWTLSGDIDFMLKCIVPDLDAFQKFVSELTSLPNVRNVRTGLALQKVKDAPEIPLERQHA